MKNLFLILLFSLSIASFGQDNEKRERIKALKVAFLTEKLELSETEAQQFWPIYNTFEDRERELRKESYNMRKSTDIASLSEKDAKKMIDEMLSTENSKHQLREKFVKDLQKILSAKKVISLKIAEDEFNKKMFEEYKKRHRKDSRD